jgi:probable dihydroxyacetone kinase regulator
MTKTGKCKKSFANRMKICYAVNTKNPDGRGGIAMANGTKDALASALRQMMKVKPIDRITVKDIVEICGVNRQTFYYHFDDVDDLLEWVFEDDAERVLPKEVIYERWLEDVMTFMDYLETNSSFTLNVYNSNSRLYMLRYLKSKMKACIESFAIIVSEGRNIDRQDFEFVTEFYATCAIGFISQWLDSGMQLPRELTRERILKVMDQSVENIIARFAEPVRRI